MVKNSILLKAKDFKYPTKLELQRIKTDKPKIKRFTFPYINEVDELLIEKKSLEDVARKSQLHWWNQCLVNRLGNLDHSFTHALVHYNRGLPDDVKVYANDDYINRVQFGYYGETYFYFFVSVRDTIAQLINIYSKAGFEEHQIYLNDKFFKKINEVDLRKCLENFVKTTTEIVNIRNGLAHRYLLTHHDNRPTIKIQNGNPTYNAGTGTYIKSSELLTEIKKSFDHLAKFVDELDIIFQPNS
ncbi:Cthe_2314 family HEPN domain-containing protein [Pedobacter sp. L105]|uniref:Cthe_2314 family HEPN domain-containing protein n=1 Tax=Pedobacter sp. L105 TaxID=1641871 RepID=UPI00131DCD90|nr:Cthe_2314 family HEPN domain-containing protein [Pedobacter sp. L105]